MSGAGGTGRDGGALQAPVEPRSFLFLQGPISDFYNCVGRALIARGHRVHRVNLHLGDQLLCRLPATHYRGQFDDWRGFVAGLLEMHRVTDLVIHGDRRPYNIVAAEEARARGIAVIATDLGYVRPDWVTLERDGMNTYSRFPRDPAAIRALAEQLPAPDLAQHYHTPFWLVAALDILYTFAMVLGRPLYPHYRNHGIFDPLAEYAGWIWSRSTRLAARRRAAADKARLLSAPGSYFLVPLQLATDFQIRSHSPFVDARDAVREVIASFARSSSSRKLVLTVHPLDNGLIGWTRLIRAAAREFGIDEKVIACEGGGTPNELLSNAAGIVTINSTIGTTALQGGVPVKVLGNAVFDLPGLTSQQPLDDFWRDPAPPDPELAAAFLRALIGTTQIKGGYYERAGKAAAVAGFVARLEDGPYPLPPLAPAALEARPVRPATRNIVLVGVSSEVGLALARAYAEPGTRLWLIGALADGLAVAAEDCRRRGALVETVAAANGAAILADQLQAVVPDMPIEAVVVQVERDAGNAMAAAAAFANALECKGQGRIVLVAAFADLAQRPEALVAYGDALRRRLAHRGVSVCTVAPSRVALHLARRFEQAGLAATGPDRAARLIRRGLDRQRERIAIPGPAAAMARTCRLGPTLLRDWLRNTIIREAAPVVDAAEEQPAVGESGIGN